MQLTNGVSSIGSAFQEIRRVVAEIGFKEPEKAYLVYYDGPTRQVGLDHVCGQEPARASSTFLASRSSMSTPATQTRATSWPDHDDARARTRLRGGGTGGTERLPERHVCDFPLDLMTAVLTGEELEAHVLDSGRNDYYGHSGSWTDVQDSHFLERLDSPDRTPPAAPDGLRVGDDLTGFVRVSWQPSTDDIGPVAYRISEDGQFVREVTTTTVRLADTHDLALFAIRAADGVGRLSAPVGARFRSGAGWSTSRAG